MTQMDADVEDPRMQAIKRRCVFACLQQVVTAHDDHAASCPSGCGW